MTAFEADIARMYRDLDKQEEELVLERLSLEFRRGVSVSVRRPWWMPEGLYRALMRTIVIEKTDLDVRLIQK